MLTLKQGTHKGSLRIWINSHTQDKDWTTMGWDDGNVWKEG